MSFRTRLTSFFILIVVVPMIAVGVLVFRLIGDSEQGKADARASGLATAAASLYNTQAAAAQADARTIAQGLESSPIAGLRSRLSALASQAGLSRITVTRGNTVIANVGDRTAVAPGQAKLARAGGGSITVTASTLTAGELARDLTGVPGVRVIVRDGSRTLGSAPSGGPAGRLPPRTGSVRLGGVDYQAVTQSFPGFGNRRIKVSVLSDRAATASSLNSSRLVAAVFIAAFLLLAFAFSVLASRALQGQISRFLEAARRLGGGDFSSTIPTEGRDDFAALGAEFNSMSTQLAHRLDELSQERARLRESIRRIGQTFAANLDRPALLELALKTAMDAVQADRGRLSVRSAAGEPLAETARVGSLVAAQQEIYDAERAALKGAPLGEASAESSVLAVTLGPGEPGGRPYGLITVARSGQPFSDDDRELLRSLAAQTTVAVENVELHYQVRRQAVTDELTGLSNHGSFQDLLTAEVEQVRRYHHQVGLIMLDIDNFKSVNDTYGHQQGDVVLKQVARVLRETSRDADSPARYGGEEMALILPHTDLDGSYAIAERVRTAIAELRIPGPNGHEPLRVTASLGVAASSDGDKELLVAEADAALYAAKRQGKNQTVRAQPQTANVVRGE
jgi:diguanylate cyclase (GGDEF)-like protein